MKIFYVIFQGGNMLILEYSFQICLRFSLQNQLLAGVYGIMFLDLPRRFREPHGSQLHWHTLQMLVKQWPTCTFPKFYVMPYPCNSTFHPRNGTKVKYFNISLFYWVNQFENLSLFGIIWMFRHVNSKLTSLIKLTLPNYTNVKPWST